ncbi:MAG: transcriptional regulator, AraC family [Mucilaginibacter sp.]|nr:transcriptional regulator, AraC family [Mucilaginibacter sp.]
MKKETLHVPYEISFDEAEVCTKFEHGHNFFELAFIRSGTGRHSLNQSECKYHPGQLFLVTPEDTHHFLIETKTEFFFLRFNNIYLEKKNFGRDSLQRLEYILQNANHHNECILKNITDRSFVAPVVETIYQERAFKDLYNEDLIQQLVNTLILIVARNIANFLPGYIAETTEEKAVNILQYIQQNIYDPEKLRAEQISYVFSVSVAYVGRYFKKHTNDTLQQYISKYKVNLIEHRIKFSDKRMNEIADEFGFTDVSHLNKFFRKQKGYSPRDIKKPLMA